jgi:crotonobetainyl-CoA:carnitine CoA-transferase CaiB-like acyl-CoA transferase
MLAEGASFCMLQGTRVVEISNGPALRFCGWLFAANGASVTTLRVDTRELIDGSRREFTSAFLDAGKTTFQVAALSEPQAQAQLSQADVVIAEAGIDWSDVPVSRAGTRPITGTIDPFASEGPYSCWEASELILASLGGATQFTTAGNGTPVFGFGNRFQYLAGTYLYCALVSMLISPSVDRERPYVRVSAFETVVALLPYLTTQYEYNGSQSTREQSGPRYVCRCKDGWVCVYAGLAWPPIAALLEEKALEHDPRFVGWGRRLENSDALGVVVDEWCAQRTVAEAEAAGLRNDVAITAVRNLEQVLEDHEFDMWIPVRLNDRDGRVPALAYIADGSPVDPRIGLPGRKAAP